MTALLEHIAQKSEGRFLAGRGIQRAGAAARPERLTSQSIPVALLAQPCMLFFFSFRVRRRPGMLAARRQASPLLYSFPTSLRARSFVVRNGLELFLAGNHSIINRGIERPGTVSNDALTKYMPKRVH